MLFLALRLFSSKYPPVFVKKKTLKTPLHSQEALRVCHPLQIHFSCTESVFLPPLEQSHTCIFSTLKWPSCVSTEIFHLFWFSFIFGFRVHSFFFALVTSLGPFVCSPFFFFFDLFLFLVTCNHITGQKKDDLHFFLFRSTAGGAVAGHPFRVRGFYDQQQQQ